MEAVCAGGTRKNTTQQLRQLLRQAHPFVEERHNFEINKRYLNEYKLGHGNRWGSKPRTTVLARASRKLQAITAPPPSPQFTNHQTTR
jgi:hypothetical protein